MKIVPSLKSGFSRAAASWKGILVTWIISLTLAALIAVPLKAILKTGFGSSMITERFINGINTETFTDMGQLFKGFIRSMGSGFMILFLVSFIANAFLTGGLFASVNSSGKNRSFWQSCAINFRSFLLVQTVLFAIIFFVHMMLTGIPSIFVSSGNVHSEKTIFLVVLLSSIVFFLVLPVFLIVADYARVFVVTNAETGFFTAIGHGFRQTFRNIGTSWILMLLLILIQFIYLVLCFIVLSGMIPASAGGAFLFFLLSQLLFAGRIFLRVFRFGCVASLTQLNN